MRLHAVVSACFTIACCCFLCRCAGRMPVTVSPESKTIQSRADTLLQKALSANAGLESIKGLGRVQLKQNHQTTSFRAAWIGKQPDKFRLEILAVSGQPVYSFATDGKRIYLLSYSDNRLYRRKASENALKRIVSVDMTADDLLDLLSGRLPIRPGGSVRLEEHPGSGDVLVIDGKGHDDIERIFLDADSGDVNQFERRNPSGKLLFRAVFEKHRETEGFQTPQSLLISNDEGAEIDFTVQQCWVNPELTADQFKLKAS